MSAWIVAVRLASVRLGFALGRFRPVRDRVLLVTDHADRLGGNLACLSDELARTHPSVARLEVAGRPSGGTRGRLRALVEGVRAGHRLARSRVVIIDDYYFPLYAIRPRPGTTAIQVWHACGAFKKFGYSVRDKTFGADEALLQRVPIHANYDVCLVSATAIAPHYAEGFGSRSIAFGPTWGSPGRTCSAIRRR